jgi:hypothetical protein
MRMWDMSVAFSERLNFSVQFINRIIILKKYFCKGVELNEINFYCYLISIGMMNHLC